MNPGISHLWMMVFICLLPLIMLVIRRTRFYLPAAINGLLLIPLILWLFYSQKDPSSIISSCCFILFLIAPLLLQKRITEKLLNNDTSAVRLIYLLKFISPAFPSSECLKNLDFLLKSHESKLDENSLINLKATSSPSLALCVQTHILSVNWDVSEKWLKQFSTKEVITLPWLTLLKIRIDCEKGNISEAVEYVQKVKKKQNQLSYYIFHLIYLCSFNGYSRGLNKIIETDFSIPEDNKTFWKVVCDYNNPELIEQTRPLLQDLVNSDDVRISRASEDMLNRQNNTGCSNEELETMVQEFQLNFQDYTLPQKVKRRCTVLLILLNAVFFYFTFSLTKSPHQFDPVTDSLGMKLPEMLETGQYWRMLTTTFLHSGPLHFFSNMVILMIFGLLIERFFKARNFLFIYFASGIIGMAVVTTISILSNGPPSITIGASGSTMSLLGAYIAVLIRQNKRSSIKVRKQQIIMLGCFLAVQSYMDLQSENISFTAHIVGLVFGLISAYFLYTHKKTDTELKLESVSETDK